MSNACVFYDLFHFASLGVYLLTPQYTSLSSPQALSRFYSTVELRAIDPSADLALLNGIVKRYGIDLLCMRCTITYYTCFLFFK